MGASKPGMVRIRTADGDVGDVMYATAMDMITNHGATTVAAEDPQQPGGVAVIGEDGPELDVGAWGDDGGSAT